MQVVDPCGFDRNVLHALQDMLHRIYDDPSCDDGLRVFPGPVAGSDLLACSWTPEDDLAGFGGSVWALVEVSRAIQLEQQWAAEYHRRFPENREMAKFFSTRAGPGVVSI